MPGSLPRGSRRDDMHNTYRNPVWPLRPSARFPGRSAQQRNSSGEAEVSPVQPSIDAFGVDPRSPGIHSDYHTRPPSFSSTYPTNINHFAPHERTRSTSDQSSAFGTRPQSQESHGYSSEAPWSYQVHESEPGAIASETAGGSRIRYPRLRPQHNRDEFDGPAQFLPLPLPQQQQSRTRTLLSLPVSLTLEEQDEIARLTNDFLSCCAFHFVATYQFPIPIERDKPPVSQPSDREWTEWAFLLKKLATKRRIPARVLFEGQIKQLVTTLENSLVVRQTINPRSEVAAVRSDRDDRYMLQLVSSGLQVAKILKDSEAMEQLDQLYMQTEALIFQRRRMNSNQGSVGVGHVGRGAPGRIGRGIGTGGAVGTVVGSGSGSANVH